MTAPILAQPLDQARAVAGRRATSPLDRLLHVCTDLALILLGFWLAHLLRYEREFGGALSADDYRPFGGFLPVMLFLAANLLIVFGLRGVYRLPRWTSFLDEALRITSSAITSFSVLIVFVFYYRVFYFSRLIFLYALCLVVALLIAKRLVQHGVRQWMRSHGRWVDRVLVIGTGPAGQQVMSALIGQPDLGYEVVGCVDDAPLQAKWGVATQRAVVRPAYLGTCRDLSVMVDRREIDEVIIALPATAHEQLYHVIEQCRTLRVPFMLCPDLFELSLSRVQIHFLNRLPMISLHDSGIQGWNYTLKRLFDLALAGIVLLIGLLPMLLIAMLIRLDSPGPILFRQQRVGRHGRVFTCYKFRSMRQDAEEMKEQLLGSVAYSGDRVMFKMKDDPRRTRMGVWLRRTSLDELPNIFNVLRGEMSIVGPRPHLPQEVARYEPWQRQRLAITPGITCLWQVNGRSNLSFEDQTQFDLYYAEYWSLWLDIKIILRTIPAVLTARGAY